jgi:pimeloyl-ACP methyl ester carboxylesterase
MESSLSQTIPLRDGRRLGYAEAGDPAGFPLLYFHGSPGSRLEAGLPGVRAALEKRAIRCLAIDRPGLGVSTFKAGRRLIDWPADVAEFTGVLGLGRFLVLGVSGGGPYAAACAMAMPDRVAAAGIVAGVAPPDAAEASVGSSGLGRLAFTLGRWLPWTLRAWLVTVDRALRLHPDRLMDRVLRRVAEVDRRSLRDPELRGHMLSVWREAFRHGSRGPWWDLVLASRPWGFGLADVSIPINLWFGGEDRITPPAMGRYLATTLARSEARFYPAEGHISIVVGRLAEILDGLIGAARRRGESPRAQRGAHQTESGQQLTLFQR